MFQLLGELLLDRHNFTTMTRYISNPDNLKLMMMMLREKSRNIQFEAFHVFKVGGDSHNILKYSAIVSVCKWLVHVKMCMKDLTILFFFNPCRYFTNDSLGFLLVIH